MELPFVAYFDVPEMLSRGDIVGRLDGHQPRLAPPHPRPGGREGAGGGLGRESRRGHRLRHRLSAGPRRARRRRRRCSPGSGISLRAPIIPTGACSPASCARATSRSTTSSAWCRHSDYEVIDDWHVLGMRATSSKTVRCKDVFVPAHRVLSMYVARPGHSWPGLAVHTQPALPDSDLRARRARHRRLPGRQCARGARDRRSSW